MKLTREKRPDRVICKWGDYEVELGEDNQVYILDDNHAFLHYPSIFPKSEIPNLIKALE